MKKDKNRKSLSRNDKDLFLIGIIALLIIVFGCFASELIALNSMRNYKNNSSESLTVVSSEISKQDFDDIV